MTQTTGGNQPTWSSGQINGLPALGLNGSSQELARVGGITYSGNISIYIVWKATSVSGNAAFTSNTLNGGTGFEYRINNSGKQEALKQNTASIGTSTTTLSSGTWYETAVTYDGTSASFYLNGTADGTATSAQTITVGIDTLFSNGNTGEFFPGQVAEILIYNSSSYQTAVHTYYMGRYGI